MECLAPNAPVSAESFSKSATTNAPSLSATSAAALAPTATPSTGSSPARPTATGKSRSFLITGAGSSRKDGVNVKQPELHYPDEDRHWLLMRLSPCPQCGYQPRLGRSIVRQRNLFPGHLRPETLESVPSFLGRSPQDKRVCRLPRQPAPGLTFREPPLQALHRHHVPARLRPRQHFHLGRSQCWGRLARSR